VNARIKKAPFLKWKGAFYLFWERRTPVRQYYDDALVAAKKPKPHWGAALPGLTIH
jgi:hypothetical protein